MKKTIISVLRLTILVCVLVLLPAINKGPEAQSPGCGAWTTYNASCPNCCTVPTGQYVNVANTATSGYPNQIISIVSSPCGVAVKGGCTVSCTGDYDQANQSATCCSASGGACDTSANCCTNGYICRSNGTCGTCSLEGESCGTAADCCVTGDTCSSGVCTAPPPPTCHHVETCTTGYTWNAIDCQCELYGSPIIIDVSGQGFDLTSAAGGVRFDISGTGKPIQIGWTAPGADNAFLCLPDADGRCDDGKDLFGNFTPQPPSNTANGFAALAVYDLPANGGNGDGIIDSRDAIFSSLRLWIDVNHDGISQPEEMHTLPSIGVESISLDYQLSKKTDQYGNLFRYRSKVNPNDPDPSHVGKTAYDVFFATH
jgi:hypothetical protein